MQWVRTSRVAKIVAVFFLLWTGADLVKPDLCALDREATPPLNGAGPDAIVVAAASQDSPTPVRSTDDCFCCSHNVLNATGLVIVPAIGAIQAIRFVAPARAHLLRARLYHPPQFV